MEDSELRLEPEREAEVPEIIIVSDAVPQVIQGFWQKLKKEKESQDCCDVPDFPDERLQKGRSGMATAPFL